MSIMCVLALCAVYGLNHDFHWDVSGAFLVPELDSEMYVQMPPGFQKYDVDACTEESGPAPKSFAPGPKSGHSSVKNP